MDTKQMEQTVMAICHRHQWILNPQSDLNKVTEELGEVCREVRRIEEGRERPDEIEPHDEVIKAHIAEEIGDVLFPLIKVLKYYGLSLEDAFLAHQQKMAERYQKEEKEDA
ncbi:MazG nucleotide pyrophosphohydrolase domain-containing protein [Brevibacillus sp. NPDC058079]|uniref:MazG nucleotide pyrophosphohydrolase domain-containing protein n=1 Tax=Brevibacillus sp. NPDC058079 TaxID=3346330 RepID=UPI0036F10D5F